jgi:hypothetical protein
VESELELDDLLSIGGLQVDAGFGVAARRVVGLLQQPVANRQVAR